LGAHVVLTGKKLSFRGSALWKGRSRYEGVADGVPRIIAQHFSSDHRAEGAPFEKKKARRPRGGRGARLRNEEEKSQGPCLRSGSIFSGKSETQGREATQSRFWGLRNQRGNAKAGWEPVGALLEERGTHWGERP